MPNNLQRGKNDTDNSRNYEEVVGFFFSTSDHNPFYNISTLFHVIYSTLLSTLSVSSNTPISLFYPHSPHCLFFLLSFFFSCFPAIYAPIHLLPLSILISLPVETASEAGAEAGRGGENRVRRREEGREERSQGDKEG